MRTGCSYLAPHHPAHIRTDLQEIHDLGCDDVLLAFQENDTVYFPGKLEYTPQIARDLGIRPIAVFWGGLNFFGGGRSSQFLLAHPEAHQVGRDGAWHEGGCYNHPRCVQMILDIVDQCAEFGFEGFFVDEPSPTACFCPACESLYEEWNGNALREASEEEDGAFRRRCVLHYIERLTGHLRTHHPKLETMCCIMPVDQNLWRDVAAIDTLDALGTDLYWANEDRDLEEMRPYVREMAELCREKGKIHQEWFQSWGVNAGREERAAQQGEILISEKPDALYTWAFRSQLGTSESADDPERAWECAARVLRKAKE